MQTATFLDSVRQHRLYALFHLVALTLDTGALSVARQRRQAAGRVEVAPPKSGAGIREVALDHTTVTALRQHRYRQQVERETAGERWVESGHVVTFPDGRPLSSDRLTRIFAAFVGASGLPPVTIHGLRHGAATMALAAGAGPKTVQAMLGHSLI